MLLHGEGFLCGYCSRKVERDLSDGKRAVSCGCMKNKGKMNPNYKHGDVTKIAKTDVQEIRQKWGKRFVHTEGSC